MKKNIFIFTTLISILLGIQHETQSGIPEDNQPYFGLKATQKPTLFAPGIVSTGMDESTITFSPDGKSCYWTMHPSGFEVIVMSKVENGKWTKPKVAPFSGKYLDGFPAIHPDGSRFFFHSYRPTDNSDKLSQYVNIWYMDREGDGWSKPKLLEGPVNGEGNACCPSVTEKGTLYFSKVMPDGKELIVRSQYINNTYMPLEPLPSHVNTSDSNFHACIAPDDSYIIVPRNNRDDIIGGEWNYYIAFRNSENQWSEYKNLGYLINNTRTSTAPSVSSDGKYFFFQAKHPPAFSRSMDKRLDLSEFHAREVGLPVNMGEDIYWVDARYIETVKSLEYTDIRIAMRDIIVKHGVDEAIQKYRYFKDNYGDFFDFSEAVLNNLGYEYLKEKKYKEAIEIFRLNTSVYPDSYNVYDSLGEAYMNAGHIEKALLNYQKSLDINPKNENARHFIELMKQKDLDQ